MDVVTGVFEIWIRTIHSVPQAVIKYLALVEYTMHQPNSHSL